MDSVRHPIAGAVCELLAARVEAERQEVKQMGDRLALEGVKADLDEAIVHGARALAMVKAAEAGAFTDPSLTNPVSEGRKPILELVTSEPPHVARAAA